MQDSQDYQMTSEELIADFPSALKRGDIFAHYQPQYNHCNGRIVGAEALMRWEHPEYGRQLPIDFIPALEDAGLIVEADLYLFEQVCQFHNDGIAMGIRTVPISFNVSRLDLSDESYLGRLEDIRKGYDIPVDLLRVEITESSAIGGQDLVLASIGWLHDHGYIVEMDGAGRG